MKIGIVSRGIPTSNHNIGIFEYDQALALHKKGFDVTFFVLDMRSFRRKRKFGMWSYKKDGIPIYIISIPIGAINYKLFNILGQKAFSKLYNYYLKSNGEIDILHAHFSEIGAIVKPIADRKRIAYVFTEHSSLVNRDDISDKNKALLKRAIAQNFTITVSEQLRKMVYKHTGKNSVVIPNIIDTNLFKVHKEWKKNKNSNKFVLCTVSRLEDNKGLDILLQAFALFVKSVRYKASLVICGTGSKYDELKSLCIELQIENFVEFKGFCERTTLCKIYNQSDCFILTSKSETFGVSYLEAISSGIPVIATRCGGPEDFVNDENGILVEVGDVQATLNAMMYMYNNSSKFDPIKLHNFVEQHYSQSVISEMLYMYYKIIIDNEN